MSFYFDDDNDDNLLSQTFQTPSTQKKVTFSQSSPGFPLSQLSSHESPEKRFSSIPPSQNSASSCLRSPGNRASSFVCQNCGEVDNYYTDEGGIVTCNHCFTQSQTFGGIEEEMDYEETQHMAARNRDGTLKKVIDHRVGKAGLNPDGTRKLGRPSRPVESYDRSKKPPSLEECLVGFRTILQKSCRILCFELMAVPARRAAAAENGASSSKSGDESEHEFASHRRKQNERRRVEEERRSMYQQISKTLKGLLKAYLWSWKEGADFYAELYPQIRFSLRDSFLPKWQLRILYRALGARAEETLIKQVQKEAEEKESPCEEGEKSDGKSDSDSEDDFYDDRMNKKIKTERDESGNSKVEIKTEMDTLYDLFERSDKTKKADATDDVKIENKEDDNAVVSEEDVPVPDVILSNSSKTRFCPSRDRRRRRRRDQLYKSENYNFSFSSSIKSDPEGNVAEKNDNNGEENEDGDAYENFTVASESSMLDPADIKNKTLPLGNRKRVSQNEQLEAGINSIYGKMIYYHNKLMMKKTKSKTASMLGRKEAALLLIPNMTLVLGLLLVAASPYGVTEGQIIEWVENGSLPILHAFSSMLPKTQKETLIMIAPFFSLPIIPAASNLKHLTKRIHVACGYRTPKVKLVLPESPDKSRRERILSSKSLSAPGRLVRPSTVPHLLIQMVAELGFSQTVLNYSLALMGLSVSRQTLKTTAEEEDHYIANELKQPDVPAPWDSDTPPVFDLRNPEDRIRKRRYNKKLSVRRLRARKRRKLGITVEKKFRNIKYRTCGDSDLEDDSRISVSNSSKAFEQKKNDRIQNRPNRMRLEKNDLSNDDWEWLPPPLFRARPHRLDHIEQILAVVLIACKLIPDWDKNHQYVFSGGRALGQQDDDTSCEIGMNGGESNRMRSKAKDRFVPWNYEQFRHIRNGKTELDYLEFLKEGIFRGSNYALPKFVESLDESQSPSYDSAYNEEPIEKFGENRHADYNHWNNNKNDVVAVPDEVVLGWKRNHSRDGIWTPQTPRRRGVRPYRLTKSSDTLGIRTPDAPLGPLIEYMAVRTDTNPVAILNHLIEFDQGLACKAEVPEYQTVPLDVLYNRAMNDRWTPHQDRRIRKSSPPDAVALAQNYPHLFRQNNFPDTTPVPAVPDIPENPDTTAVPTMPDFPDIPGIPTEGLPENDDLGSVGETEWV